MKRTMTLEDEVLLGALTITATILTPDIILDLVVGISTYTLARLFYYYFGERIKSLITRLKGKLRKKGP